MTQFSFTRRLLVAGALLALGACAKLDLKDAPQPGSAGANVTPLTNPEIIPVDAVQVAAGNGAIYYFRWRSQEASGGSKIYQWQSTAANGNVVAPQGSPGAPVYVPSPGAIDVATTDGKAIIVGKDGNIYFQYAGSWVQINGGGLQFTKLATLDLTIAPGSLNGLSQSNLGLLYAIATDKHVYQLDFDTNTWTQLDPDTRAQSITVDQFGQIWIVTQTYKVSTYPTVFSYATLMKGGGYGHPFDGWTPYSVPGSNRPSQVTTTGGGYHPGIEVLCPGYPTTGIYFLDLFAESNGFSSIAQSYQGDFTLYTFYGDSNQFWLFFSPAAGQSTYQPYVTRSPFDGS